MAAPRAGHAGLHEAKDGTSWSPGERPDYPRTIEADDNDHVSAWMQNYDGCHDRKALKQLLAEIRWDGYQRGWKAHAHLAEEGAKLQARTETPISTVEERRLRHALVDIAIKAEGIRSKVTEALWGDRSGEVTKVPEWESGKPACDAQDSEGYVCTRKQGHEGEHRAWAGFGDPPCSVWPNEDRSAEAIPAPRPGCAWCRGNPIGLCAICQVKPSSPETYADNDDRPNEAQEEPLHPALAPERIELWEAIHEYARASYTGPERGPSDARMNAVVRVENAVSAVVVERRRERAPHDWRDPGYLPEDMVTRTRMREHTQKAREFERDQTLEECAQVAVDEELWTEEPGRLSEVERRIVVGALQSVARAIRAKKSSSPSSCERKPGGET